MRIKYIFFFCCLASAATLHANEKLPLDVKKFIEKRDSCDHFRGEVPDPDETERMRSVQREIKHYCTGTDNKLALLKKKYVTNAVIAERLSRYEPEIEAKRMPAR